MDFNYIDEPDDWVCAKIPNDGRIKKDCVSKVQVKYFSKELTFNFNI